MDAENYENFLTPEQIHALRDDKMMMIKSAVYGKKSEIWKPTKYEFPKHIRELLNSQKTAEKKLHTMKHTRK